MAKDPLAQFVIGQARSFVAPDGDLVLEDVKEGTAHIRYLAKKEPSCSMCVMSVDDLRELLAEQLRAKAPHIKAVEIVVEQID
ncbi:hypothetical protein [Paraburkholderia caffeinilytica]|uniref:hypothetical protein n=1 Tax=Paraburkholderia caffeinilytica TaxID=1761016 RepID=UPI0038B7C0B9